MEAVAAEEPLDLEGIALPAELRDRLREAAELYSVTELDGLFNELAELGEAEARLAERLRGLRREHDIEAITRLIDDLPHG